MPTQTILIADDEPYVLELVGFKLEELGFEVIRASNGREAFDLARAHRPALVVTDYQMPVMDGVEFGQAMFADPELAATPVIMLTARGFRIPPPDLSETNIIEMHPKPFSPKDLADRVRSVLAADVSADAA